MLPSRYIVGSEEGVKNSELDSLSGTENSSLTGLAI